MAGEVPMPDHISRDEALMLIKPDNWSFYKQGGGMKELRNETGDLTGYEDNSAAENKKNLTPKYYENIIKGKTKGWIDVYVLNKLGSLEEGKPVYPSWREETHLAKEPLIPDKNSPIFIGIDFGLTPSAVFGQRLATGRWIILHELVCFDMGATRFAEVLKQDITKYFRGYELDIYGDPAGDFRAQTDERTPFQMLRQAGIMAKPAPSNDISLRTEAVESLLNKMADGKPCFLLDNRCINLKKGFNGGYHYRRLQTSGDRYDEKPNKNRYSHVHDALQYCLMGAGEGRVLVHGKKPMNPRQAKTTWNVFDKQTPTKRKSWNIFGMNG